jgi:hypothetical protein
MTETRFVEGDKTKKFGLAYRCKKIKINFLPYRLTFRSLKLKAASTAETMQCIELYYKSNKIGVADGDCAALSPKSLL